MMKLGEHVPNAQASEMYDRFRSYVTVEENLGAFFRRDFLAERGWRAAVVSEELSSAEARKLASVCGHLAYKKAWVLDIDHFDSAFFYNISLDEEALKMLEEIFVTPSYMIVEDQERFMLVSDGDYYWEIAGPKTFVEDVLQKSLDVVDREFMDATRNYRQGSSQIGRLLNTIAAEAMERSISAN